MANPKIMIETRVVKIDIDARTMLTTNLIKSIRYSFTLYLFCYVKAITLHDLGSWTLHIRGFH